MSPSKTFVLAVLAGAFIAFGSVFFTTVTSASTMSYGVTRLLGGLSFCLGLVLVIVGGAELFTGNNLIIMAWANKKVSTLQVLKNWCLVYLGNFVGALFFVVLMLISRQYLSASGMVGMNMLNIAKVKCELGFTQAIALGILCNILVCLAVWLCFSSRSVAGKIISILFPVTAFVSCGFEHSIANMYLVPKAIMLLYQQDTKILALIEQSGVNYDTVTWSNFFINNLFPVTLGNIIGGAVLVGLVYWFVYLRNNKE
jgi:formate/nitrite transporter